MDCESGKFFHVFLLGVWGQITISRDALVVSTFMGHSGQVLEDPFINQAHFLNFY
jgi:hypothetical protein